MERFTTERDLYPIIGDKVKLEIKILKTAIKTGDSTSFDLDGRIEIYGVEKVINDPKNDQIKRNKNIRSTKNNQTNCFYFTVKEHLQYLNIFIEGDVAKGFDVAEGFNDREIVIKIVFKDAGIPAEVINVKVQKQEKKIEILVFESDRNIVQNGGGKSSNTIKLRYKIDGEGADVSLLENGQKLENGQEKDCNVKEDLIEVYLKDKKTSGLYEYTLLATKDKQKICKRLYVYYLDQSVINKRSIPDSTSKRMINFCASQEGDYLYALFYNESNDIFEIGITDQIDGADTWLLTEVSGKIRPFANAAMIHLQSDDERIDGKYGRLFFIGGSMVGRTRNNEKAGNQVATITIDDNNSVAISVMRGVDGEEIDLYKYGHTCVLFPTKENTNTIWMLGGQDFWGNTTQEVWTSTNGINWAKVKQSVLWSERVMASSTVLYNANSRKKEALWLAGGFSEFAGSGGGFQNDVWVYQDGKWETANLPINDISDSENYACAIAYGGQDQSDAHTGLYVLGSYMKDKTKIAYLKKLSKGNRNDYVWENNKETDYKMSFFNNGIFITAFFKECLWFLGVANEGGAGISYGELNYRIPTIHQKTIDFYKNKSV